MWTLSCTADVPELIGLAEREAGLDAGAGEPDREAAGVVIAARAVLLGVGGAAELAAPPDQRILEQSALLQVGEQAGDGAVDGAGVVAVLGEVRVLVPRRVGRAVAVRDLDEPHALLAESPGEQALAAEVLGDRVVDPVQGQRLPGFMRQVEHSRGMALHPPGQLIRGDHRVQLRVARPDA